MLLARGLISLGIEPGDRVALVAESRPEWVIADLAIMSIGADHGPGLYDEHGRRSSPRSRQQRRVRGDRLDPFPRRPADPGRRAGPERAGGRRDRAARPGKHVLGRPAFLGLAARRHRAHRRKRFARPHRGAVARRYGVPDLHLRHRRRAEGGHAEPPQHHRQLPRRLSPVGTARPRRRGVPLLSAAVAFLRAHRRADVSDLDRRRDLFRRGRRHAGRQSARSAPDDHDRGAAAVRDDAPAHPPRHPARAAA